MQMAKKIWFSLVLSLMVVLPAQAARAATITLTSTCSFAKAVAWVNTPGTAQAGCSKSGTFGSNDTIIVGLNYQEFTIDNTVEIKKSLLVQSWSFYGNLTTTNPNTTTAIKIVAKDIHVRFSAIVLRGVARNKTTGFYVAGTTDTNNSFTAKLSMNDSRITGFRRSAISIFEGGVDLYNSTLDDNSNRPGNGGAVRIESSTKYGRLNCEYCYFSGNVARRGGAIYNHGNLNITSSMFYDNVATKFRGGGTGAVVYAEYFPTNYYTAFGRGGHFENNRADTGGYAIAGGATAEFSGTTPFTAVGNTSGSTNPPLLCENPIGEAGCPTQ
jgi:predicted outer membrane repeat protein